MTLRPKVWDDVLHRLGEELPPFSVDAWLSPLVAESDGEVVRLRCPTRFHRDRVRDNYLPNIVDCFSSELGRAVSVELELGGCARPSSRGGAATPPRPALAKVRPAREVEVAAAVNAAPPRARGSGGSGGSGARARSAAAQPSLPYTFANFVTGPCNALAREAAFAIASKQQPALKQIYLCSGRGLGKTHLARAIVAESERLGEERGLYSSAEGFTSAFMSGIREGKMALFKRRFRNEPRLLVLDDVHFLEGKVKTQLELFHTLQHVLDAGGRVVLSGDRMPQALDTLEPSLRSQLASGFVAELAPPSAEMRRHILRDKAAAGGVGLPEDCLELLAGEVEGSVRELESVLIQLVTTASLLQRKIDLELTREALAKKLPARRRRAPGLEPAVVVETVAAFFKTRPEAMVGRSRRRDVLVPRQLAMYLCHRYTDASLAEIGRALGRDHPAVRNAITRVEHEMLEKAKTRYRVEALCERLDAIASHAP